MRTIADLEELLGNYPPETLIRFSMDPEDSEPNSGLRYFSESGDDVQTAIHRQAGGRLELTLCLIGKRNQ